MSTEIIQKNISVKADSITIGSPTNGQIKVYGDALEKKEFETKIRNMKALRKIAEE